MDKQELKKLIDTAAGRIPADLVIKNCKVVNVFREKLSAETLQSVGLRLRELENMKGERLWMQKALMRFRV